MTDLGRSRPVDVPFEELVYRLAESVAAAQTRLDRSLVESVQTYAETRVPVTSDVVGTDETAGHPTTSADPADRSLLELGLTPTRYQFAEATVEVEFDMYVAASGGDDGETESEPTTGAYGLLADTDSPATLRQFDREATATASLSARLVPVPSPPALASRASTESDGPRADASDT